MLDELIETMPRGSSIYKRENIHAWVVSFPASVPNRHNQFKDFTDESLESALNQAFSWYATHQTTT